MTMTITMTTTSETSETSEPSVKTILQTCDNWDTDYNSYNWEPEFMTIFVTWQSRPLIQEWHWTAFAILAMFSWKVPFLWWLVFWCDFLVETGKPPPYCDKIPTFTKKISVAPLTWMVKFPSIGTHRLYLLNKFPDRQGPPVTKLPGFGFREIIKKQWDHYILADGKDDNQTTAHCPLYEVYKKMSKNLINHFC